MTKFEEKHQLNTMKSCFFYSVKKLEQTLFTYQDPILGLPDGVFAISLSGVGIDEFLREGVDPLDHGRVVNLDAHLHEPVALRRGQLSESSTLYNFPKIRQYMYHFISIQVAKGIVFAEFQINFRE